jgi:hypothetical protein
MAAPPPVFLTVRTPMGQTFIQPADPCEPVMSLKVRIGVELGFFDPEKFALLFRSQELREGSVADAGLADGSLVDLSLTLRSGRVRICECTCARRRPAVSLGSIARPCRKQMCVCSGVCVYFAHPCAATFCCPRSAAAYASPAGAPADLGAAGGDAAAPSRVRAGARASPVRADRASNRRHKHSCKPRLRYRRHHTPRLCFRL